MGVYAPTFMKKLYDEEILGEEFLLSWFNRKRKLDKNSILYDRKAEKIFKE